MGKRAHAKMIPSIDVQGQVWMVDDVTRKPVAKKAAGQTEMAP